MTAKISNIHTGKVLGTFVGTFLHSHLPAHRELHSAPHIFVKMSACCASLYLSDHDQS